MKDIDRFRRQPDFEHFRKVLMRETREGPVPDVELAIDAEIMMETIGFDFDPDRMTQLQEIKQDKNMTEEEIVLSLRFLDLLSAFHDALGYDYTSAYQLSPIARTSKLMVENPGQGEKVRAWQNEHGGLIPTRADLDAYPWPDLDQINTMQIDIIAEKMAPGMKVFAFVKGVFEDLMLLMGFENMAIKSIEDPQLCGDILQRLTVVNETVVERTAAHPATGAILYSDDMGFNTHSMVSPRWMREWVIPRLKRLADICHGHGKPFILHSCGQIDAIMEDLIEEVGIDGRHSYQDNIEPVEEVYRKYSDRISILGGVDVDVLARGTVEQVRKRTREILEACAPGGGYLMGSGNSVTNYCKLENYFAMLDETRKWNREHGGSPQM